MQSKRLTVKDPLATKRDQIGADRVPVATPVIVLVHTDCDGWRSQITTVRHCPFNALVPHRGPNDVNQLLS